ncbi:hypothetical protein F5X99DRAFT_368005 [Biscogniauxia marginata]|nr:hypothetical protein F5X99DRAFT_368005 [Biscogniauxia marginata]
MEPSSNNPNVMRWDGASRSSSRWNNLRRDPELWYRDGNCYIHLYGQGHSRRGPAFKVPFSALLEANCHPLIDRFMAQDIINSDDHVQYDTLTPTSYFSRTPRQSRIELFIPAPSQSDKKQSYNYHLATRNFIAFVLRRSMVGETLGTALITLVRSMCEFRTGDVDNVQDLMNYLDEEGYLYLKNQPCHALAMLHLAEVFQLRDLYIDAFAHCCGMSDRLFMGPGYHHISSFTRKLIRRTRVEMDLRLGQSGSMLRTFLRNEMSDVQLGLFPGARAHLEQFRKLLHEVYTARFGYYPPPSIDPQTMMYEAEVFRTMRDDFEALHRYLVDESFDTSQKNSFLEQGGICTLWSIKSFDARHKFEPLPHPLPLLPEVPQETITSRRVLWFGKKIKPSQTQRSKIHAALLKATNRHRPELLKNELVQAYRQFEENSVCQPPKASKSENLGPMDARKVRWVLVYAIYQVLRQATDPPPEVKDFINAPYHLCISRANLPLWDQEQSIHAIMGHQKDQIARNPSISTTGWSSRSSSPSPSSLEIKPDIDYFAIARQEEQAAEGKETSVGLFKSISNRSRVSRSLSRNLTARRPLSIFTKQRSESIDQTPYRASYQEIVVHGYGNGTSNVGTSTSKPATSKQPSSVNRGHPRPLILDVSVNSSDYSNSEVGTLEILDTSVAGSPSTASTWSWDSRRGDNVCGHCEQRDDVSKSGKSTPVSATGILSPQPRRARTTSSEMQRPHTLHEEGASRDAPGGSGPRNQRPRSVNCGALRRKLEPPPLNIRKADTSAPPSIDMPAATSPISSWDLIKAVMEIEAADKLDDIQPQWEQYTDLGGLQEPKARRPSTPSGSSLFRRSSAK